MAQDPPSSIDVTDIQFKVHDRFTVFNHGEQLRSHVSLLATASNYGLMFVGNPNEAELKVILIKDLVENKTGRGLHARQVQLPNLPNCLAVSCDGAMLAVNYTQNGCGFVAIYSVPSFTTANIKSLHNIRLPGDESISALQLLWNPVIPGNLAVVMSNGSLGMYEFKNNSYEFHTLDAKEQINCGSWSPKGKQIVLGFANGKLAQYKPDLKLARSIACPPNIHPGPFNTISIQWLSTFQFAAVFLQNSEDASPSLYIVHAPKAGNPTYTNYYDVCYSGTGPRAQQVNLMHIQPWNLLLVTSANGVEVGLLGTKETTEAPKWVQYMLLDEARIEMPLTDDKDETYPIGFALDTSSTHQLTIAEKKMPVMPMIHVLSTHGQLVSFNFLNLQPNTPDICSAPPPLPDLSGLSQFKLVSEMLTQRKPEIIMPPTSMPLTGNQAVPAELTFSPLGATSTPALEKPKAIFGTPGASQSIFGGSTTGFGFNTQPAALSPNVAPTQPFSFRNTVAPVKATPQPVNPVATVPSRPPLLFQNSLQPGKTTQQPASFFSSEVKKPIEQVAIPPNPANVEKSKPLYTVPPTFTPPAVVNPTQQTQQVGKAPAISSSEVDEIVNDVIALQINFFDAELRKLSSQSKGLLNNIGSTEEMKGSTKRLNDLQEIVDQANDKEFESDLQSLRNLLNESYAMVAECRSKLNLYNNPDIAKLTSSANCNPINRRQLAKLNCYLATNQAQLQIIHNQIDAQWASFQDLVRRNSRTQMHTPCLEGVYQRMTKLKDMIARERTKLNFIKSRLREKGLLYNQPPNHSKPEVTMESLTDTILSMTLAPAVEENQSRLTTEKLNAIRELLRNRKIAIIKPQRPDRVGLNSEVILETKMKSDRKIRDGAATNMDKMEQERIKTEQQRVLTKPTATKAVAPSMASISQPNAPTTFGFGGISPFVKPSPGKPEDFKKDQPQQQPAIVKPVASTAAPMFLKATPSTTSTTQPFAGYGSAPNANPTFGGFSITPTTMPAFTGFGTNAPLTFGAPKPLIPNVPAKEPSNAENAPKDQPQPLFQAKPFAPESKPFASPSFSSPFAAVAPSKPTEPADKENKVPEIQPFVPVGGKSEASVAPINFGSALASAASSTAFSFISANTTAAATASSQAKTTTVASTPFTFSFGSALNSEADSAATQGTQLSFAGLAKPTPVTTPAGTTKPELPGGTQTKTDSAESISDASSSINLGTLGLPITPNPSPTPFAPTADSVFSAPTSVAKVSDPTDSFFGSLNICKPTSAESVTFKPTFGGFGPITSEGTQEVKSIFGATTKEATGFTGFGITPNATKSSVSTSAVTTAPSTAASASTSEVEAPTSTSEAAQTFSFGLTTTPNATKSAFEATATVPSTAASASTSTTTTTTTESFFEPNTAQGFSFGITTSGVATPAAWSASSQATSTSTAPSLFTSPTGASVFAATAAVTTSATTTTPTGGSLFGGLSFGTPTSQATPSIFGATATSAAASTPSSIVSPFAGVSTTATTSAAPIATPFGTAASTAASSIFASAAATTTPAASTAGKIFGGIPKPDQTVFGRSEGSVFGAINADPSASGGSLFGGQTSVFGGQPKVSSGGSIFGGTATGTGQISSPFGAASNTANAGGNIFGSPTPSSTPNVFGTNTQSTTASGGSIFDQSSAGGQSGGSLFTGFGQGSSPFAVSQDAGGSIFGGSANAASPKPSAFGSPTSAPSAFGSVNTGGFGAFSQTPAFGSQAQPGTNPGAGSFAQSGSSITQTGFGSPSSGTAFAKPVFGGAPAFGAAPAFGSPPSFGSAPSFGSPKGFGSFAAPVPTGGAFTSPTQKNNLFEALGSSDTGLSFGNLAQNTNANQQKPAFGGSSFMSYRS